MTDFILSLSTRIEAPANCSSVENAVRILKRDLRETLTENGPANVIRVEMDPDMAPEHFTAGVSENEILLTCGDDLGAVYALLSVNYFFSFFRQFVW